MMTPNPTELNLHRMSRVLEVSFDDGANFKLPAEYLRVYSPSAEVAGHGQGQRKVPLARKASTSTVSKRSAGLPWYCTSMTSTNRHLLLGNPVQSWQALR